MVAGVTSQGPSQLHMKLQRSALLFLVLLFVQCVPGLARDCNETESSDCHQLALCSVTDPDPAVCECPVGVFGNGTYCTSETYVVRMVIYFNSTNTAGHTIDVVTDKYARMLISGDPAFSQVDFNDQVDEIIKHAVVTPQVGQRGVTYTMVALFGTKEMALKAQAELLDMDQEARVEADLAALLHADCSVVDMPKVYAWTTGTTSNPLQIEASGLLVQDVTFKPNCKSMGCWIINVMYATGTDNVNVFYVPRVEENDKLGEDLDADDGIYQYEARVVNQFQPRNFPCGPVSGISEQSDVLPTKASACCIPQFYAKYRAINDFEDWAVNVTDDFDGCGSNPAVHPVWSNAPTLKGLEGGFSGLEYSEIVYTGVFDQKGQIHTADIYLHEYELRTFAGMFQGTLGVEYTIDTFIGLVQFRPTGYAYLDSFTRQTRVHVEKSNLFTVSTWGYYGNIPVGREDNCYGPACNEDVCEAGDNCCQGPECVECSGDDCGEPSCLGLVCCIGPDCQEDSCPEDGNCCVGEGCSGCVGDDCIPPHCNGECCTGEGCDEDGSCPVGANCCEGAECNECQGPDCQSPGCEGDACCKGPGCDDDGECDHTEENCCTGPDCLSCLGPDCTPRECEGDECCKGAGCNSDGTCTENGDCCIGPNCDNCVGDACTPGGCEGDDCCQGSGCTTDGECFFLDPCCEGDSCNACVGEDCKTTDCVGGDCCKGSGCGEDGSCDTATGSCCTGLECNEETCNGDNCCKGPDCGSDGTCPQNANCCSGTDCDVCVGPDCRHECEGSDCCIGSDCLPGGGGCDEEGGGQCCDASSVAHYSLCNTCTGDDCGASECTDENCCMGDCGDDDVCNVDENCCTGISCNTCKGDDCDLPSCEGPLCCQGPDCTNGGTCTTDGNCCVGLECCHGSGCTGCVGEDCKPEECIGDGCCFGPDCDDDGTCTGDNCCLGEKCTECVGDHCTDPECMGPECCKGPDCLEDGECKDGGNCCVGNNCTACVGTDCAPPRCTGTNCCYGEGCSEEGVCEGDECCAGDECSFCQGECCDGFCPPGSGTDPLIQYINSRLNQVKTADGQLQYVAISMTVGKQFDANPIGGAIPIRGVLTGKGDRYSQTDLLQACTDLYKTNLLQYQDALQLDCAPAAKMCEGIYSIPDQTLTYNVPLGPDFFDIETDASNQASFKIFVDSIVSLVDKGTGMKAYAQVLAEMPLVQGGVMRWCESEEAKTDLVQVANADLIVGSGQNMDELYKLRNFSDVASSKLKPQEPLNFDTDSIQSGLMTLVLKGLPGYFDQVGTQAYSLELEDVITVHIMEEGTTRYDQVMALVQSGTAFRIDVDRQGLNVELHPEDRLSAICPFYPRMPSPNDLYPATCVTRRDRKQRSDQKTNLKETLMELPVLDGDTSKASEFMQMILGQSDFADLLGHNYSQAIARHYDVNQRYIRAFWINPGYQWMPQTFGTRFTLSQRLIMFCLINLDEGFDTIQRRSAHAKPKRMILAASTGKKGSELSELNLKSKMNPALMLAQYLGVDEEQTSVWQFVMQLELEDVCREDENYVLLKAKMQEDLSKYLESSEVSKDVDALHISSLTVTKPQDLDCSNSTGTVRRKYLDGAQADIEALMVFKKTKGFVDVNQLRQMPGVLEVRPVKVGDGIILDRMDLTTSQKGEKIADVDSEDKEGGMGFNQKIGIICGAVGGAIALVFCVLAVRWQNKQQSDLLEVVSAEPQFVNPKDALRDEISAEICLDSFDNEEQAKKRASSVKEVVETDSRSDSLNSKNSVKQALMQAQQESPSKRSSQALLGEDFAAC